MRISFLGAAREVTGSCFLVETGTVRFIVDCGMFQGSRATELRNWRTFRFKPKELDFVLLTHAHIDHSGLLPKLVHDGYGGPIYAIGASGELLAVMLPDSGHIQEMEALRAQRHGERHAKPLYSVDQAHTALRQLVAVRYDEALAPHPEVRCRFRDGGHILGSAIIEVWVNEGGKETKLVFSGDLGQPDRPLLNDPTRIDAADLLFVESTYGDRLHKGMAETLDEFVFAVNDTLRRKGGNVVIPAFAVGRTQEIIYWFYELTRQGRFRDLHIFVDSPMATEVTRITMNHLELFDQAAREQAAWRAAGEGVPQLTFIGSVEESMALNAIRGGAVIISASGMCDGGRVKHHLRHSLGRRENSVIITGFQAEGTLGRRLVDGERTVRIFGEEVAVRAGIYTLGGLSAHADRTALLAWLGGFAPAPRQTFVVHGEAAVAEGFAARLREEMGWNAVAPYLHEVIEV